MPARTTTIDEIRAATAAAFAKLDERRANIPLEKRKFDDNVYWCTHSADPQAFAAVEQVFGHYDIVQSASAYLGRPVAVNFNDRVHDVMLREFDHLLESLKKLSNFCVSPPDAELLALPYAVFGEYRRDPLGIVIVVTDFAVSRLKLFDCFDVLEAGQPPLDSRKIHFFLRVFDFFSRLGR